VGAPHTPMDDSHPVASYLPQFFGDEQDDEVAVAALTTQLAEQPALAIRLLDAWQAVIAGGDGEAARALVEDFANRDMSASGDRSRAWLRATYAKLESLRRIGG
jgi:hypothetical protein